MDINEGINQEGLKRQAGVKNLTRTSSRNYAHLVNQKAKDRMERIRRNVRVMDMLQAINRYKWEGLPIGLRSKLVERVNYYRGSTMFFWDESLAKFFLLPFSLATGADLNIDFYGQYTLVRPSTFNGKSTDDRNAETGKKTKKAVYLGTITKEPVYDLEELEAAIATEGEDYCRKNLCVIFRDYTQQMSETNTPRSILQESFIDMQSEILPMLRTTMIKAAMPKLVKTSDEGTFDSLMAELQTVEDAVMEGRTMIPVTAFQDLQEIDSKNSGQVIESMAKMYEGFNNIRKTFIGIKNDGAFKKNAHMLQDEQDTNTESTDSILSDGLENRKEFATLCNRLWGLKISVKLTEKESELAGESDDDDSEEKDEPKPTADGEGEDK